MKKWVAYLLAPLIGIIGAASVIVVMSACVTSEQLAHPLLTPGYISVKQDEFTGLQTVFMTPRAMGAVSGSLGGTISIGCMKIGKPGTQGIISLWVSYQDDDWMFIDHDSPLDLLIDAERISLELLSSPSTYIGSGYVTESANYRITPEEFKKIAFANEVKVRIHGKGYRDRYFTASNFDDFKKFYTEHVIQPSETDSTETQK